jgi:glycosyltransferase involved in cell wall biosynthesis
MLEAMACGALVIGSDTPPVAEVIEHGVNGLLVPFFEPERIAEAVLRVLADETGHAHLAEAGRRSVMERYDLRQVCLPRQLELVQTIAAGSLPLGDAPGDRADG